MEVQVVDYRAPDAARRFTQSLHETGFGVLTNHPIPQALVERIYKTWLDFFNGDEKSNYAFSKETQDGWFSTAISETAKGATQKDIKEYYHVYPWGRIPAQLKEDALAYYAQANALAAELLGWVEQYTPPEIAKLYSEPLSNMIKDSSQTLLRVLRYPPLTGMEPPGAVRAAAHGDINLLTILPASNEPGLQVMGNDKQWRDVPCDFGSLAINIGDMLQEASRGYYPSTQHQVLNPVGESAKRSRVSLPLFLHPRNDVVLSERYTANSYLQERLRELGVKGLTQQRVIRIEPEAPAKPAFGAPCNGCGVCCPAEPCPVGILVSRKTRGACSALRWSAAEQRYRCGLLISPRLRWLRPLLRRWIAAGSGCDALLETEPR